MSKKIKIGIDAKWYYNGPPSGHIVVKNLVDQIVNIEDDRFDIFLFIDSKHKLEAQNHFPKHVRLLFVRAKPNLLSNLIILPLLCRQFKLDVVLFQNFSSFWPGAFKKIVYIHDILFLDFPEYYGRAELLYFKPMRFLARRTDYIITISESEKNRLIKHQFAAEKEIGVVYHGISNNFKPLEEFSKTDLEQFKKTYNLPSRYLLFVGRLNIRKNLHNLINSLEYLDDKDIKLVIVGKEDHKNITLQSHSSIASRLIFMGHIPEQDLYLMYANATLFCFPSFAEGFGLPPLEAMKCGVPAVVSHRTSMPEICGDAAIYINPDDSKDIAEKINELLNNAQFFERKKSESLVHAKKFSWKSAAQQILNIAKSVVDS